MADVRLLAVDNVSGIVTNLKSTDTIVGAKLTDFYINTSDTIPMWNMNAQITVNSEDIVVNIPACLGNSDKEIVIEILSGNYSVTLNPNGSDLVNNLNEFVIGANTGISRVRLVCISDTEFLATAEDFYNSITGIKILRNGITTLKRNVFSDYIWYTGYDGTLPLGKTPFYADNQDVADEIAVWMLQKFANDFKMLDNDMNWDGLYSGNVNGTNIINRIPQSLNIFQVSDVNNLNQSTNPANWNSSYFRMIVAGNETETYYLDIQIGQTGTFPQVRLNYPIIRDTSLNFNSFNGVAGIPKTKKSTIDLSFNSSSQAVFLCLYPITIETNF